MLLPASPAEYSEQVSALCRRRRRAAATDISEILLRSAAARGVAQ